VDEGIVVRNVYRTTLVPWPEFVGFSLQRWRAWRCMALIDRSTGPSIPIGVLAGSPMYWDTRIEVAVAEL
jgi:hypothetical protein